MERKFKMENQVSEKWKNLNENRITQPNKNIDACIY